MDTRYSKPNMFMPILGMLLYFTMLVFAKRPRRLQKSRSAKPHRPTHTPLKILEEAYHLRS